MGKLKATRGVWVIVGYSDIIPMIRGGHLNWGAFDHPSHAPQLRSCNCKSIIVEHTCVKVEILAILSSLRKIHNASAHVP